MNKLEKRVETHLQEIQQTGKTVVAQRKAWHRWAFLLLPLLTMGVFEDAFSQVFVLNTVEWSLNSITAVLLSGGASVYLLWVFIYWRRDIITVTTQGLHLSQFKKQYYFEWDTIETIVIQNYFAPKFGRMYFIKVVPKSGPLFMMSDVWTIDKKKCEEFKGVVSRMRGENITIDDRTWLRNISDKII